MAPTQRQMDTNILEKHSKIDTNTLKHWNTKTQTQSKTILHSTWASMTEMENLNSNRPLNFCNSQKSLAWMAHSLSPPPFHSYQSSSAESQRHGYSSNSSYRQQHRSEVASKEKPPQHERFRLGALKGKSWSSFAEVVGCEPSKLCNFECPVNFVNIFLNRRWRNRRRHSRRRSTGTTNQTTPETRIWLDRASEKARHVSLRSLPSNGSLHGGRVPSMQDVAEAAVPQSAHWPSPRAQTSRTRRCSRKTREDLREANVRRDWEIR